jgi:ketosteroid isomerase-like protein
MHRYIAVTIIVCCGLAAPALADVPVEVRAHEEAFARACQAGDLEAVLALYANDASVIWPGKGEEAKDKAALQKLATRFCKETKGLKLTIKSLEARSLGADHIGVIGHWEVASIGPDGKPAVVEMRASEVLKRRPGGKLEYVVDHGSVGLPPAPCVRSGAIVVSSWIRGRAHAVRDGVAAEIGGSTVPSGKITYVAPAGRGVPGMTQVTSRSITPELLS